MCLSCSRTLHRPYRFELDGQAQCGSCHSALPAGGSLFEDVATRLVLVWLGACQVRWLARFMVARSLHLRPVGRLLASACMAVLYEAGMPAAALLQPVGLRQVAPVFPAVTL